MNTTKARPRGVVSVLALILMAMLATLGVSYAVATNTSLRQASNGVQAQAAQYQAESGLAFLNYTLRGCPVPDGATGEALLDAVATHLSSTLEGTANLQGAAVGYDSTTITVPSISMGGDGSFSAQLSLADPSTVRLVATGQDGQIQRTVGMDYQITAGPGGGAGQEPTPPGGGFFFGNGVASRSKVRITGNAKIRGASSADEATVLSATYSDDEAIKMTGNAEIQGDVFMSNPNAYATLTGNVSIGGEDLWGGNIDDHIHVGIGDVEFPEVDPSVFEAFATTLVTASTPTSGNRTFTNIRIAAGANPTFSGNITLKGVVFIEAPNQVHFSGNLTIKGVIVTQDAGEEVYDQNTVKFTGNTSVTGVETLPDTPEFQGLREMPGSFLLAPGFGVRFTGNFGTVSGTMAADSFTFSGNAGGTVKGMIINYSDSELTLTGNSRITIDRSDDIQRSAGTDHEGTPAAPPGFALPSVFAPVPSSYREYY